MKCEHLAQRLPGGILCCGAGEDFPIREVNPAFLALFGYTRQELEQQFGDRFAPLMHPEDLRLTRLALAGMEGDTAELEYRVCCKDGALRRMLSQVRLVTEEDGTRNLYCVLMDITRRKESQEALRLSAERMQVIMDQTNDIIFEWDLARDVVRFSSNWKTRFGSSPIGQGGLSAAAGIHPEDREIYGQLMASVRAGNPYSEAEYRIASREGPYLWHRARVTVQFNDSGRPVKAVGVLVDIDADKHREQALLDQARRDSLTSLFNKSAVQTQAELLIDRWSEGTLQALLIIDLDNFKNINDQYGHLCGDTVLSDLAACLKRLFRATDSIGRVGGDEFLAYLPDLPNREIALYKAQAVLDALADLPLKDGVGHGVSCSIGIAFYPEDGLDYATLYHCADMALYQIKCLGKSGWAVFDPITCHSPAVADVARSAVDVTAAVQGGDEEDLDRRLAQYAFQLLYSAVSAQTAVQQILALAGRTYDVSRAYIFELRDRTLASNTFEWCGQGVQSIRGALQNVSLRQVGYDHLSLFDSEGVLQCREIERLPPVMRDRLARDGVTGVLQCVIQDEDTILGFVGLDMCGADRCWSRSQIRALLLVAGVLSTFLLKLRLKERMAILEGRPDAPSSP